MAKFLRRVGDYKLILGYPGLPCDWVQVSEELEGIELETTCPKSNITERGVYLFNIKGALFKLGAPGSRLVRLAFNTPVSQDL
ncbi:hypothetical protein AVEN_93339-1 [Araneus ventricosus]|uniref:Uncharacterized protein n=1 Tax=Araneus ventricosus TaxID=182803 RepID=A0A4Y2RTQ7_ARAVE|nr:hypothetical protein AVEN_129577-1 [Araneus ventricosus]GBN79254.1 hypothetical protein AVEN_93339-1 [Araneus ventricosus]